MESLPMSCRSAAASVLPGSSVSLLQAGANRRLEVRVRGDAAVGTGNVSASALPLAVAGLPGVRKPAALLLQQASEGQGPLTGLGVQQWLEPHVEAKVPGYLVAFAAIGFIATILFIVALALWILDSSSRREFVAHALREQLKAQESAPPCPPRGKHRDAAGKKRSSPSGRAAVGQVVHRFLQYWDLVNAETKHKLQQEQQQQLCLDAATAALIDGFAAGSQSQQSALGDGLPDLCPSFMRASGGGRVEVLVPCGDKVDWRSQITVTPLCPSQWVDRSTGPAPSLLDVVSRWAETSGQVARVLEVVERGPTGKTLASVSSNLEVWLEGGACFGRLRFLGGRRYVFVHTKTGRPLMCLSVDPEATSVEFGSLPEGFLLATAERARPGRGAAAAGEEEDEQEQVEGASPGSTRSRAVEELKVDERLQVLAKPGVDVVFVLVCTLAVTVFAPPAKFNPGLIPLPTP